MNLNILKKEKVAKKETLSLREQKHQANLRKNNGLHFQIGLIAALFIVFGLFQMKFVKEKMIVDKVPIDNPIEMYEIPNYIIEKEIPKEVVEHIVKKKSTDLSDLKIIDNDADLLPKIIDEIPEVAVVSPSVGQINLIDVDDDVEPIPMALVSEVPIFPGCEKYTDKKKQFECMSKKIAKHVNRKFNTDVASDNGITGKQRISVTFVIDSKGNVIDVKARAPHPELQKEAIKAVKLLPRMKPAKQGNKKVNVSYALPITFQVQ